MAPAPPTDIAALVAQRWAHTPHRVAYRTRAHHTWFAVSWRQVHEAVAALAGDLQAAGLTPGDRVAIMAPTSLRWVVAMLAVWQAGGVVTTIYPASSVEDCAHILQDAGCRIVFVHDAQHAQRLPDDAGLLTLFMAAGDAPDLPWRPLPHAAPLRAPSSGRSPDDLAALIYTSGTTGRPKGVMLSHDNLVSVCLGTAAHTPLQADDEQYLFLPLAHIYGMVVALVALHLGVPTILDGDVGRIGEGLQETRPSFLPAVPRVFEKIHDRALARAAAAGPRREAVFTWALEVGRTWSSHVRAGRPLPWRLQAQHAVADRLVFRKVRGALGGRLRAVSSGGAPLSPDIAAFFHAVGIVVLEGYGLTESTGVSTANRLTDWRLGTVGLPGEGLEVRIADDGEVLLRGRTIMQGYHNLPEETAATLVDGWLHTGDIGELDADGFLRITDRKKHLIITAGGKNIAPARIENRLKAASPLIGEVLVHGDRRKYCVAVIGLEPEGLDDFAARTGVSIPARPPWPAEVHQQIQAAVDAVNATLASYETIKAFHLAHALPSVEAGTMTASLKLRRRAWQAEHRDAIDALYR